MSDCILCKKPVEQGWHTWASLWGVMHGECFKVSAVKETETK